MTGMRLRRVFVIAAIVVLLSLLATVFVAFSDFGSSKEPVVNGMRLRRYVAQSGSSEQALARLGPEAIPWLIKGLEARDSAFYTMKARVWKLLPSQWEFKWRHRAPIDPNTLRFNCVRALEMFGPEAAAAVPKLVAMARSDSRSFPKAVVFNALAHMATASPEAKAFLIESLREGDGVVRGMVAGAFFNARFTPPEAVPLLVAQLNNYVPPNEHSPMPFNEMLALSVCRPEEAAVAGPFLGQYITHGGPGNAINALRATGPGAIAALPRLFEILEAGDQWSVSLEPAVFSILARLGTNGSAALPALNNGLLHSNPVVRAVAAAGIASITGDIDLGVRRLVESLENRQLAGGNWILYTPMYSIGLNHRQVSAWFLGELGPGATNALPHLKDALKRGDLWLSTLSAEAIWKISRDTNVVLTALIANLKDHGKDPILTLTVLGQMGPAAAPAIPAIREAMQSELKVRRYGYVALQRIEGN